jgi:TolB protein
MTRLSRFTAAPPVPAVLAALCFLAWPLLAGAQGGRTEVTIDHTQQAVLKTDVRIGDFRALSAGRNVQQTAAKLREVVANDLLLSGLFNVGGVGFKPAELPFSWTIEATVEGAAAGDWPVTVNLNLLTWPDRQLVLTKRYRPGEDQIRTTAHHFANEVVRTTVGSEGIALTRVAFSRGRGDRRDIYVVDYDGEGLLRLTANRTLNLCPDWSPDGARIAFTSYRGGQQGLYSLETATGAVKQVIAMEGLNLGADWSPDGKELLISLSRGGDPEIYRITPDGKIVKRLTVSPAIEISPNWAPNGRELVFTSDSSGTPQLYMIDREGAGKRRVTFEGKYNDSAALSPNGEWLAYATREDVITQIIVMRPGGEDRRVVTDTSWRNCEDPSWAPDGRHLVFTSDKTGASKMYVYDVVENSFRQLTFGNDPDITPAWSR